jgi:glucose/arabinose dehydrogenase
MRFLILFTFLTIFGCSNDEQPAIATSALSSQLSGIHYQLVASGFDQPLYITNAGDGSNRIFVVEKSGRIKIIQNGEVQPAPLLDLSSLVSSGGEQGLLGLAFPPDFADKKVFYVNYTDKNGVGNTVIARYSLSGSNTADPSSALRLLSIIQPFANHNGGQLLFGQDGMLYIGTGDGGGAGDPFNNAQNTSSLLGKILRLDVNTSNVEVWAWGLRNPWRFSFDRATGDLYIADVGQDEIEEINFIPSGQSAGNFGWKIMEGTHCYGSSNCNRDNLILPIAEYNHDEGDCSVTGGHVYRGAEFPNMQGIYFYADFCSGKIRALKNSIGGQVVLDTPFQISSFGEDESGNFYFSDLASGSIYKIVLN